jgi:hypothetical protein
MKLMRIELPAVTKTPDPQAHPYPFQIGLQTQEFMQGAILHTIFMDVATSQRIRLPNGLAEVEKELVENGLYPKVNADTRAILDKYQSIYSKFVYQNVLISLKSHWDWYIDKLGAFTVFGRNEVGGPQITNSDQRDLERIGFASITKQIKILQKCTGISFQFESDTLAHATEMALVRNLGIHNRWEVNEFYLARTKTAAQWTVGDIRTFGVPELEHWHQNLINMINSTSIKVAIHFRDASDYVTS